MRIYADFNGLTKISEKPKKFMVPLDTYGSLCDLAYAGIILSRGIPLTIYSDSDEKEDLEADAIARFDTALNCWVADIDEKGYRYVPTQHQHTNSLICVRCKHELGKSEQLATTVCPKCGTAALTPILPPT